MPLDDFSPTDRSHPDAVGAALAVRAVLESAPVRHLDSRTVEICVDDERLRGAYFRFAHDADREARILIHQGDGWFHLESPLGTYDGHLDDEDLRDFLPACSPARSG